MSQDSSHLFEFSQRKIINHRATDSSICTNPEKSFQKGTPRTTRLQKGSKIKKINGKTAAEAGPPRHLEDTFQQQFHLNMPSAARSTANSGNISGLFS